MTIPHEGLSRYVLVALAFPIAWAMSCIALSTPGTRAPGLRFLGAGMLSTVACSALQLPTWAYVAHASATAKGCYFGVTEELVRALTVWYFVLRKRELTRRNAVLAGALIGLGFALLENVTKATGMHHPPSLATFAYLRGVSGSLGHASYGAIIAYFGVRAARDGRGPGLVGGTAIAALAHSAFDGLSYVDPGAYGSFQRVTEAIHHVLLLAMAVVLLVRAARLDRLSTRAG